MGAKPDGAAENKLAEPSQACGNKAWRTRLNCIRQTVEGAGPDAGQGEQLGAKPNEAAENKLEQCFTKICARCGVVGAKPPWL